ncbi:MAG TPA: hypothetical protein PK771_04600 [Spirochaetota bacterium]|nr:hypothetical protein [Spirochaetota bacterium]
MIDRRVLEKIIKECYWDYNITADDLIEKINSSDIREKSKIFNKIIENSTDKVFSLRIFDSEELRKLFDQYNNTFNKKRIEKNILALRNIFLGEKNQIKGLEWKKR